MSSGSNAKRVQWVDTHRFHVTRGDEYAPSWSSGSDNGADGTRNHAASTSSGLQQANVAPAGKPELHEYLQRYPHPINVRGPFVPGLDDNVLAQSAFLDHNAPSMTLRFIALEGVTWTRTIERTPHGVSGHLGSYISLKDVLDAVMAQVYQLGPLDPAHPLYAHAVQAMLARGGQHMRRMDWFRLWHGRLFFVGIEPQPGAAGWEFVVRLVPSLPPA